MSAEAIADVIAALRQPRTMSQFVDSADLASALLRERAEIADRLEASEAGLRGDGTILYVQARGVSHSWGTGGQTVVTFDGQFSVPLLTTLRISYAAAQRQEQEGGQ